MNPRVKEATPGQNYTVHLIFDNGEEGVFDVKPSMGTIQWKNGQDFCPDTLHIESKRLTHI
ncbi:MAG: DUF2442 domain-containing protein [Planctomycetes bacterium]|nr:DUF2442 domain-containing protein [Planctomycetota bacterium]